MGAIDRLGLDRRIAPGIVKDDDVGRGQVQADPAGLEADQEHGAVAGLECLDRALAVRIARDP
jgi:hypothetical protein